jgi:hypothetical protein
MRLGWADPQFTSKVKHRRQENLNFPGAGLHFLSECSKIKSLYLSLLN